MHRFQFFEPIKSSLTSIGFKARHITAQNIILLFRTGIDAMIYVSIIDLNK
jgi:hypothetical protein